MRSFYAGSEQAFEELVGHWRPPLQRFFLRMQFTAEDAADLTQETLLKLYLTREREGFDLERPLAPYLLQIARSIGLKLLRHRRRRVEEHPLGEESGFCARSPLGEELEADLLACVLALPEPQMVYILLCSRHGLGEYSHGEIATILEKWPAQITGISKDALRNLHRCMERKGYSVAPPEQRGNF